ncbi:MAG: hypothetical protein GXY53_07825 [Desulfobulbus sp.]|nr:hypothetical protein [Desulfobulbus sp.]
MKGIPFRSVLKRYFPGIDSSRLPGGFDRVGDVAVVKIPHQLLPHEHKIGSVLLDLYPAIRVVAGRNSQYRGEYRLPTLRVIAGENRLTTVHRENSVLIHLDLAQVYFSTRLAHERNRIAALVRPGERIAVLGSGAGPFPLIIGAHSSAAEIIGIEKNPVAHDYALQNRLINRSACRVRFLQGDAAAVLPALPPGFDRILITLPYGGDTLLAAAAQALRPGGTLHFYTMQPKEELGAVRADIETVFFNQGHRLHSVDSTVCGHCSPKIYRMCLDAVMI